MVFAKYDFGSFSRIRGYLNFRLMAACVFKHSTGTNATSARLLIRKAIVSGHPRANSRR